MLMFHIRKKPFILKAPGGTMSFPGEIKVSWEYWDTLMHSEAPWDTLGVIWDTFGVIWDTLGVIWEHSEVLWNTLGHFGVLQDSTKKSLFSKASWSSSGFLKDS
ncbi:hypothetical protein BDZ94DRAFT_1360432 [Collybia nuda]|uniref:Uncharacterized protein n=1 Tax=Collybia nuda TaxID=64659 RepID=A0A9P5XTZ5_9AGAR|nr:hypothetical protein BDZ94DRAFT_1360432 [Collybia nuda]